MECVQVLSSSIELSLEEQSDYYSISVDLGLVSGLWIHPQEKQKVLAQKHHCKDGNEEKQDCYSSLVKIDTTLVEVARSISLRYQSGDSRVETIYD